jgi:hypothetical protein
MELRPSCGRRIASNVVHELFSFPRLCGMLRAMPFAYRHRAHLQLQILDRVAAGETVAGVCAEPGMPCAGSVQVWRRADAGFASALAAARRRGDWARRLVFDEAKAAAFVARVAAGERVGALLGRPGMPSRRTYDHWRRTQGCFQEALGRLRAAGYSRRVGTGHGAWRGWDQALADRITVAVAGGAVLRRLLASDPALPCLAVVARWRREHPEWDRVLRTAMRVGRRARWLGPGSRCTPALADEIGDRIVGGASLRSLGAEADMPCAGTLYSWVARRPAFAREVARACDIREQWLTDQMIAACERNGLLRLGQTRRQVAPLQRQVNRLAKRPGWKRRRDAEG